jgi:hypothetical protein
VINDLETGNGFFHFFEQTQFWREKCFLLLKKVFIRVWLFYDWTVSDPFRIKKFFKKNVFVLCYKCTCLIKAWKYWNFFFLNSQNIPVCLFVCLLVYCFVCCCSLALKMQVFDLTIVPFVCRVTRLAEFLLIWVTVYFEQVFCQFRK